MKNSELIKQFNRYKTFIDSRDSKGRCFSGDETDAMRTSLRTPWDVFAFLDCEYPELIHRVDFISEVISAPPQDLPVHKENPLGRSDVKALISLCITFVEKDNCDDEPRSLHQVRSLLNTSAFGELLDEMADCEDATIRCFLQHLSINPDDNAEYFAVCRTWAYRMVDDALAM